MTWNRNSTQKFGQMWDPAWEGSEVVYPLAQIQLVGRWWEVSCIIWKWVSFHKVHDSFLWPVTQKEQDCSKRCARWRHHRCFHQEIWSRVCVQSKVQRLLGKTFRFGMIQWKDFFLLRLTLSCSAQHHRTSVSKDQSSGYWGVPKRIKNQTNWKRKKGEEPFCFLFVVGIISFDFGTWWKDCGLNPQLLSGLQGRTRCLLCGLTDHGSCQCFW